MKFDYKTKGTCSSMIHLDIENGIIKSVSFDGGCNGNLKGVSRLVAGKDAKEVADMLKGTICGNKGTSCPDQLSKAIEAALAE